MRTQPTLSRARRAGAERVGARWTLEGREPDRHCTRRSAAIVYRFHARDLHLVLGPASGGKPVRFRVTLDGKPPGGIMAKTAMRMARARYREPSLSVDPAKKRRAGSALPDRVSCAGRTGVCVYLRLTTCGGAAGACAPWGSWFPTLARKNVARIGSPGVDFG